MCERVCVKGVMIVPRRSTDLNPADNQVGPSSPFHKSTEPLLFIPKYQQPVSTLTYVCVCVFV